MAQVEGSQIWTRSVIEDIHIKAGLGRYRIRGFSTSRRLPSMDDLTFLTATLTRLPIEGYKESCETHTVLGTRTGPKHPLELKMPIMIAGMSFGALSKTAKIALGRAATNVGITTCTGEGGMLPEEREASEKLIYQVLPSRYGFDLEHLRAADAIEIVMGQGAKPGTGGLLLGMKVSDVVAGMRTLPAGIDQRSPTRHPDFLGADDLTIKIEEIREATDYKVPIFLKMGATRVRDDVKIAAKCGVDGIFVDGMEGATGASPEILLDHVGIPTLAAIVQAREALYELNLFGKVSLIIAGGIRNGVDAAKALALGADAVAIGTAALIGLNCNKPIYEDSYEAIGAKPYACHHCHTGMCPVGITTQDPELEARLDLDEATENVTNMLLAMNMEMSMLAKACGKSNVHTLEPEDLRALTFEASAMAQVPYVGTDMIYGAPSR